MDSDTDALTAVLSNERNTMTASPLRTGSHGTQLMVIIQTPAKNNTVNVDFPL